MAQTRPACRVCYRISGKDLAGFCARCWRSHLTEADKLAVLSPLNRAGLWDRIRADDEPEFIGRAAAADIPAMVPGEPIPIWSTGWTLWTYDEQGRQSPLSDVFRKMEHRMAFEAVVVIAQARLVGGIDVRSDNVMLGRGSSREEAEEPEEPPCPDF